MSLPCFRIRELTESILFAFLVVLSAPGLPKKANTCAYSYAFWKIAQVHGLTFPTNGDSALPQL